MKQSVVYEIKNIITGDIYIGSSSSYETRKRNHLSCLRKNKHTLRRVIAYWDYKWPTQLTSRVMFFEGEKINIEDFMKEVKLFK